MTYFEFTQQFPTEEAAINFIVSAKYKVDEFCFRLNNRDCDTAFLRCVELAVK